MFVALGESADSDARMQYEPKVHATSYNLGARCLLIGDAAHAITPFFGTSEARAGVHLSGHRTV